MAKVCQNSLPTVLRNRHVVRGLAWPKSSLNGVTILHISAACGVKSIVDFIASYIKDPNPTKENGITPIHSASQHGHTDIVIFLASKLNNLNEVI